MNSRLIVITTPYTAVLRVIKDGCFIQGVNFIILDPPGRIKRLVFHFFRAVGLYSVAIYLLSPKVYKKISTLKNSGTPVLYWNSHCLSIWMSIDKIISSPRKAVFSWAPMEEDAFINEKRFYRKIKRIEKACEMGFEFFTYNPYDAQKYNMKLTSQVYRRHWNIELPPIQRDFYFIGKAKERGSILKELEIALKNKGFHVDFRIFDESSKDYVSFEKNVCLSMGCRCVVDVVAKKFNAGQTLRPLEALFFKKKLLTNDESVKGSDFYHPSNIFVFDEKNISLDGIEKFMEEPFHEIEESIVAKYDVNNWLKHYFLGNDEI